MDQTIRFGTIMRATAVEIAAVAEAETRAAAAEAAQAEAELAAEELRVQLARKATEAAELSAMLVSARMELRKTRWAARGLLAQVQRQTATTNELLEHLIPSLPDTDRRARLLAANAYEAMGASVQAASVLGTSRVRVAG